MKKTVQTVYRVECNHGNKYFSTLAKANRYFNSMVDRGYEVELWAGTYRTTVPEGFPVSGKQVLLKSSVLVTKRYD